MDKKLEQYLNEVFPHMVNHQPKPHGWGTYFYHTNSKTGVLSYSHYSDPAFDGEGQIIFGQDEKALQWVYDDRLRQWEPEKHKTSWAVAVAECGDKRTAGRIEAYLRHYYDDPALELVCIRTGTRPFDGYPWHAYGFRQAAIDAAKGE